jgi:hypothetical protein
MKIAIPNRSEELIFDGAGRGIADYLAVGAGDSGRLPILDLHPRRGISRTSGILPNPSLHLAQPVPAQIFLSVYLRILLQPLRGNLFFADHSLQAAVPGLARLSDCIFRPGLGSQPIHRHLQPPAPGYQAGKNRNRCQGTASRRRQTARRPQSSLSHTHSIIAHALNGFSLSAGHSANLEIRPA